MGALVPIREPRGSAGSRGPLVPIRLDLLIPVGGTNRHQWAWLLAHHVATRLGKSRSLCAYRASPWIDLLAHTVLDEITEITHILFITSIVQEQYIYYKNRA